MKIFFLSILFALSAFGQVNITNVPIAPGISASTDYVLGTTNNVAARIPISLIQSAGSATNVVWPIAGSNIGQTTNGLTVRPDLTNTPAFNGIYVTNTLATNVKLSPGLNTEFTTNSGAVVVAGITNPTITSLVVSNPAAAGSSATIHLSGNTGVGGFDDTFVSDPSALAVNPAGGRAFKMGKATILNPLSTVSAFPLGVTGAGDVTTNVTMPAASITGTQWVGLANGKATNLNTFGFTNYFASDSIGNTNGPHAFYRVSGASGYSNLIEDITLGVGSTINSRWAMQWSRSPGDGVIGGIFINTDHDASPPDIGNSEMQVYSGGSISFGPGLGFPMNGGRRIQYGIGEAGGYGVKNFYSYGQNAADLSLSATGFSFGTFYKASFNQGATRVDKFPGMVAYASNTNSPGTWHFMFTTDAGFAANDLWDPNTMKAGRRMEFTGGNTNLTRFHGIVSLTNISVGSQPIFSSDETGTLNIGGSAGNINFGPNANMVYFTSSKLFAVNVAADSTAFSVKDNSGNFATLLDPANGTGLGGSYTPNWLVGARRGPAQTFDVIGTSAHSDTSYFTNTAQFLNTNGFWARGTNIVGTLKITNAPSTTMDTAVGVVAATGMVVTNAVVAPGVLGTGSSITTKFLRGDSTWQTIAGGGDALVANPLSQFAPTTSAQFMGVISDETGGTGLVVGSINPTINSINGGQTPATNFNQLIVTNGANASASLEAGSNIFVIKGAGGTNALNVTSNNTVYANALVVNGNGPTTLYGDQNATNYLVVRAGSVLVSNIVGFLFDKRAFYPSNATVSKVAVIAADNSLTNSGLGAVSINGDGTATTAAQVNTLFPGNIVTNGNSFAVTVSNDWRVDIGHALSVSNATASRIAMIGAEKTITNVSMASAANPINADGTATTFAQINALAPGNVLTNGFSFAATGSNTLTMANSINYYTNLATRTPDFNVPVTYISTNAAWVFLKPVNVDSGATKYQSCIGFITNTTAAAVTITADASIHVIGVGYVTNLSKWRLEQYGQKFTNLWVFPCY